MDKVKAVMKKVAKIATSLPLIIKFIAITLIVSLALTAWDFVSELLTSENTKNDIYNTFEVEALEELVVIKKSEDDSGYYLDFVDDFNEKVENIVKKSNKQNGLHNLPTDTEFLKKLIKAEVITQFPNLGGNIPEGSNGFQGVIDIRRVTPNKEIGSVDDNPGRGETTTIEKQPEDYNDTEMSVNENVIKAWKEGQALLIKGKATIYEQQESLLEPGKDTGFWFEKKKENSLSENETLSDGAEVSYTGTYKKTINKITKETTIYVQVETKDKEKVYVRSQNLVVKEEAEETTKTGEIQNKTVTSRAKEEKQEETKLAGKSGETYTIAIAAGHNNTDDAGVRNGGLIEEQLTIKTAEKVEELLKPYTNIKVVQTGSTSENKGGISAEDRVKLAREANPNLCIQIHFDAGGESGVQTIYKDGDDVSRQLAEFLSENMANSMNLPNRGAKTDAEGTEAKNLGIIENSVKSGFPSVVAKGGFIDGEPDAATLKSKGTDLCAEGIVQGILKYLEADHSGLVAIDKDAEKAQESIESKVYNLKYVEPEILEEYINSGNVEALKVFTLDEEKKLITATWNQDENGLVLRKNSPVNFRTALQKYQMPMTYLLAFYIDTNETKFSEELAEEVINGTEIVIAVQDNITTARTIDVIKEKQLANMPQYNYQDVEVGRNTIIAESATPKIEVTYADTWCAKFYKENSYSSKVLDWKKGEAEKIINIKGKVTETYSNAATSYDVYESGEAISGEVDEYHINKTYKYTKFRKTETSIKTMQISYDTGEAQIDGDENKFAKLYQKNEMYKKVRTDYIFNVLEQSEDTSNLLDLTKYLMYQATSNSYGVIEFNFNEFNANSFSGSGGMYGSTVQEKIWWALLGEGFSKEAAAGVLGNIEAESGFGANVVEGGYTADNGGIGLCQWTNCPRNSGSGRNAQLKAYAESKGKEWSDENTQIEYLIGELKQGGGTTAEGYASYAMMSYNGYKPEDWVNATSPEAAARAFMWTFERPASSASTSRREQSARSWYDQLKDQEKPTGSTSILATCEEIMNDMLARKVLYSQSNLIYNNIEASVNHQYACCATYVSIVLYKSGALTADQINKYNYHFTGIGGIPTMLEAAGWKQVSHSEIQPGDVINDMNNGGKHVLIYAGGDMVYDNNSCVLYDSGPGYGYGGPVKGSWSMRIGDPNVQVWRAP